MKRETDRDLERDMGGVKVIRKQLYSKEERIARALEVMRKTESSPRRLCLHQQPEPLLLPLWN